MPGVLSNVLKNDKTIRHGKFKDPIQTCDPEQTAHVEENRFVNMGMSNHLATESLGNSSPVCGWKQQVALLMAQKLTATQHLHYLVTMEEIQSRRLCLC